MGGEGLVARGRGKVEAGGRLLLCAKPVVSWGGVMAVTSQGSVVERGGVSTPGKVRGPDCGRATQLQ